MDTNGNKRVGDYELLEVLGTGAQGQVCKAQYHGSGKPHLQPGDIVAIKILNRGSGDPEDDNRFKRQADVLERLDHPSICRYIDYFIEAEGEFDEVRGLVMEFLDGESLTERLKRYPRGLPFDEVKRIFEQCLDGLAHAAERSIIHRDLKPSNIYITRDGTAKLIDFGIARQEDSEEVSTAGWKGSFDYMSPDFVTQEDFHGDERSDVFSMGVCFVQALTGELPFPSFGENAHIGYIDRWQKDDEPRPSFRHKSYRVLTRVKPFIMSSLCRDREERYATFQDMLEGLQQIKYRVVRHRGKDDYELIDVLGRGGFGEVYKGRRASDEKLVAIKHLFTGRQASRFIKEAKLLQKYAHPDIVGYYDFIEVEGLGDDKEFFLVMEYLPGMPGAGLNARIRRARNRGLEPAEVIEMFIHFLSALQYLHESPRPIIHRDIKPGNLYAPPGQPQKAKLFDLGVARDVSGTLTTGMIPGTLDYMAPEFAKPGSDRGTPQSDLYAMGVSLYEALTGAKPMPRLPKADQEAFVQFVARSQNPPQVPYTHPVFEEWPRLKQVCERALDSNPKRRYKSTRDMLQELERLLQQACGDMEVDPDDVPTRATIVDPNLLERIKAHQADRPDKIPSSEMEHISEEPSKRDVESRPDWMEEEDEITPHAPGTPSSASQTPYTGAQTAAPPARPNPLVKIAAILLIMVMLGVGGYFVMQQLENPRDAFIEAVKEMGIPQADEAYARRLMSMRAQAKEMKLEDPDYASMWDDKLAEISELGEQIPAAFDATFAQAVSNRNVQEAERIMTAWKNLSDGASFMGYSQRDYITRLDDMRAQIGRFEFLSAVAAVADTVPAAIGNTEQFATAESVAGQLAELEAGSWDGIPEADRREAFDTIRTNLVTASRAFIIQQRDAALTAYQTGDDGAAAAERLAGMQTTGPGLVAMVSADYQDALDQVAAAQGAYERTQRVAATLQRLRQAVPETIGSEADVAQAEAAVTDLQREASQVWEGVPEADKTQALNRIRDDLATRAAAYVTRLETAATARFEALEPTVPEVAQLDKLRDDAPALVELINGRFAEALQNLETARTDRDATLTARADAAERERMDAERQRMEEEQAERERIARMEQEQQEARIAAAVAAYDAEETRVRGLVPERVAQPDDLLQAKQALAALQTFRSTDWEHVDSGRRDAAVTEAVSGLRTAIGTYLTGLRDAAIAGVESAEGDPPEWTQLQAMRAQAPALVTLVNSQYEGAVLDVESALRKRDGINEFTVALDAIRGKIPNGLTTDAQLAQAEEAARAFIAASGKPWDVVSESERTEALSRLRDSLSRQAAGRITLLRDRALRTYGQLQDAGDDVQALEAMKSVAPTLVGFVADDHAQALAQLMAAGDRMQKLQAFTTAVAGVRQSIPAALTTAEDIRQAESAAAAYQDAASREWDEVTDAEQSAALDPHRQALASLVGDRVDALQRSAVGQYQKRADGDADRAALEALSTDAPTLVGFIPAAYDQATQTVADAQAAYLRANRFARASQTIRDAIPAAITSPLELARAEKTALALDKVVNADWSEIPEAERTDVFGKLRRDLVEVGRNYADQLKDAASAKYDALEDGDAEREQLLAMKQDTPTLVGLITRSYDASVQAVDTARAQKLNRVAEMEAQREREEAARLAEMKRQEELRAEQERLAQLKAAEQGQMTEVRDAWNQVQTAWTNNRDDGLQEAYGKILGRQFELDEFKAAYQQIQDGFVNGLKARIGGSVASADAEVRDYRSHLYQVSDPSFGGSYRIYQEEAPAVAISLPNMDDVKEIDLGFSRAELLRLQAWSTSGSQLTDGTTVRTLSETLGKLAVASRKQQHLETASLCDMESLLLLSEPAVFPAQLEEVGEPVEIFRWRAHATYQPETSALDVLRDLERYADRGGHINEYDVRLALFASYYSWRNAIEGETQYAQRVRKSLEAVLSKASATTSTATLDFIAEYVEAGGDDDTEFPGLYILNAMASTQADSPLKQQAASWLASNGTSYQRRVATIRPQLDLLRKLLGT